MGYEKRQFLYGMDLDTEERLIQPGFSRKNVNVRIGSSTDNGVYSAENIQGNTFIPNTELPSGTNKVIGSCWDKLRDLSYYFVYNSEGSHGIFEYNHVKGKIDKVMIAAVLNFQSDELVTGHNVVEFDKDNHLLYFTDGFNPPRKINIEKSKNGDYLEPIKEDVIDAIKYPPLSPPKAYYGTSINSSVSYLNDSVWQFKAAYVYDDKELSAFSPISIQILPSSSLRGDFSDNFIRITVSKGGDLVERVVIAGRDGNINDFLELIDQDISKYDTDVDGNYFYDFFNDGTYNAVSLPKSNKLFDSLPQKAKAQEYIEGNRISYGNVTEGYEDVDVDFDLDVKYEEEDSVSLNTIKGRLRISNDGAGGNLFDSSSFSAQNFQPIHNFKGDYVYGGIFARPDFINQQSALGRLAYSYHQKIPLGGFVVYLAGTDYYEVTKQIEASNKDARTLQDNNNVYDSSDFEKPFLIRAQMKTDSDIEGLPYPYDEHGTWSTFEFNDIPDGTYIMRVASHMTTESDLLAPGRAYQKTSALVNRIGTSSTFSQAQERSKELIVTVKDGQVLEDLEIVIADLSPVRNLSDTKSIAGYLVDNGSDYNPESIQEALGKERVHLSLVGEESLDSKCVITDHNGFFFLRENSVRYIHTGSKRTTDSVFRGYDFFNTSSNPNTAVLTASVRTTKYFVVSLNNEDVTEDCRTKVILSVIDSSDQGVEGVSLVANSIESLLTQTTGEAKFIVYAPGSFYFTTAFPEIRAEFYAYGNISVPAAFNFSSLVVKEFIGPINQNNGTTVTPSPFVIASLLELGVSKLKNGGTYSFGLVYYDRANRSGATNIGDKSELVLPFYTEQTPAIKTSPLVNWDIKHLAPSWATHYQWVRTPNTAINKYLQWYTSEVDYFDLSGALSNFNDASTIGLKITNLTEEYKLSNPDSVLVYDFTTRDRVRFIKGPSGNYLEDYIDVKVLSFETGVIKVENSSKLPNIEEGVMFEVYTPKLDVESDIYYEIGEFYKVLQGVDSEGKTVRYHQGYSQDQDPANPSGSPAKGVFFSGDTYYRYRDINSLGNVFTSKIDSQLFSDFWQSRISDIGRPNIIDKNAKTVDRITTIYYSDRFLPETNINGLNSFFDTAFETFDRKYGSIQKLFSQDKRLDCYQETKTGKILVEENVIFDQFDQGTIASSSKVLSKIIYYKGDYGTLNPESFVENEGRRYWFDVRNGKVLRLSNDGITPLSDKNMHGYFESKSNFYSAFNLLPEVWGVFDENFDEYIIAFGSVSRPEGFTPDELALVSSQADQITETKDGLTLTFDILYSANSQGVPSEFEIVRDLANGTFIINSVAGDVTLDRQKLLSIPPETLGFSEKTGYWTSFYSYAPECMVRIGVDFLSFKNGQAYLHNTTNAKRNSFYGEERGSEVWAVFNQNPSNVKVFQALSEESDSVWQVRDIFTQGGQRSNLNKDDFSVAYGQGHTLYSKENIHYAPFWKDENTPNVDNPLIEGDSLRDVSILVKLINDSTKEERLFAASINYSLSERSNR